MTPAELDDALDAMQAAASDNPDLAPGLITVESGHWVNVLAVIGAKCARLDDGLRHREIKIHIGSAQQTAVLSRAQAGERGAPFRDLAAR